MKWNMPIHLGLCYNMLDPDFSIALHCRCSAQKKSYLTILE